LHAPTLHGIVSLKHLRWHLPRHDFQVFFQYLTVEHRKMKKTTGKTLVLALGTAMATSFAAGAIAAEASNPFQLDVLDSGYMADATLAEGKCGEGKCGEGKCGDDKGDDKGGEGKCGEGKCGGMS
jgi:uncharacterized low-complexity protein